MISAGTGYLLQNEEGPHLSAGTNSKAFGGQPRLFLMPPCCPKENSTSPVPEPRNDWLQCPTEAILLPCNGCSWALRISGIVVRPRGKPDVPYIPKR